MGKELDNILQAVGRTPLVRLNKIARGIKSTICVKPEMLTPGGLFPLWRGYPHRVGR